VNAAAPIAGIRAAGEPVRPAVAAAPGRLSGRVLLIETDTGSRLRLADGLRDAGLAVEDRAGDAAPLADAEFSRFDLLIVDVFCDGIGGLEGCRRLRCASDVPIVILTARDAEADRVLGLEAGADGFIDKPFSMAEAVCRVRAILRRRQLDRRPAAALEGVGDLVIDFGAHRVIRDGESVALTPTELRLLALLTHEPGRAFSPGEILRHLWRSEYVGDESACKAHISNLRHKLERDPSRPRRVVTIRGVGYVFKVSTASDETFFHDC
jgi:two-component system response regulator RegX3